jgi:hypothetical protein
MDGMTPEDFREVQRTMMRELREQLNSKFDAFFDSKIEAGQLSA